MCAALLGRLVGKLAGMEYTLRISKLRVQVSLTVCRECRIARPRDRNDDEFLDPDRLPGRSEV